MDNDLTNPASSDPAMSRHADGQHAPRNAFQLIGKRKVSALHVEVEHWQHVHTGAVHWHLASDHPEMVFMVAFRTVPQDSTGVAHILEHTTLCGSERYPVRDPFFMMTRRSLNTFMNAFTSSDWTAYPFASQNTRDFENLLEVYLDATFFPNLHPLDFAQEGHRLEFSDPLDPASGLEIKGVVYNEMKGAMSSAHAQVWAALSRHLYPESTYVFNSGGDPDCIPMLTHAQLLAFHQRHYHPSNAVFMTFGSADRERIQQLIHERALARFDRAEDGRVQVESCRQNFAPVRVQEFYPASPEECEAHTHILLAWLWDRPDTLEATLEAHLLSNVLMENSASPLRHALETTRLGTAPSGLCGLEDGHVRMAFVCGIEGSEAERADDLEALVMDVLEETARTGVSRERVEAVLHQLELGQREISGDSYPYGLQLMLASLAPALQGAEIADFLDIDDALATLRSRVQDPDYLPDLIRRLLVENRHRIRLVMSPDAGIEAARDGALSERLARLDATMQEDQRKDLVDRAAALAARQQNDDAADAADVLPGVSRADVPATIHWPKAHTGTPQSAYCAYEAGTNGLVYRQVACALPPEMGDTVLDLPLLTTLMPELGLGDEDYLTIQDRQSAESGGVGSYWTFRSDPEDEQQLHASLVLSSKALVTRSEAMHRLLARTATEVRFDELPRIRELVSQLAVRKGQSITGSGHTLAMTLAAKDFSPAGRLQHETGGMDGIQSLLDLNAAIRDDDTAARALSARLEALFQRFQTQSLAVLDVAEADHLAAEWQEAPLSLRRSARAVVASAASVQPGSPLPGIAPLPRPATRQRSDSGWLTNTQVNFCATAYATVPGAHPDSAPLTVLAHVLRNRYLHSAIREKGGAYGGGASQNNSTAVFNFYSYRDPRLEATLDDFAASITSFLDSKVREQTLDEAVLGVISGLDKPGSPAGEAKRAWQDERFGRGHGYLSEFRRRVLEVTVADLKRVAADYLAEQKPSIGIIAPESAENRLRALGLEIRRLRT